MNSSDRNARRDLGALYAAFTVKSLASGLTPAARKRAIFPAEFATNERAERGDERIDALQSNYRTRFSLWGRRPPCKVYCSVLIRSLAPICPACSCART